MLGPSYAGPSDAELMLRIQRDDSDALGLLYDRYGARALRFASQVCRQPDTAEDVVHEAFVSIWKSRAGYEPAGGEVGAWTMAIVRNRAIDALRRERGPEQHGGDDLLARLPDTQRQVIALAFYGQLTHSEIAEQLALPRGTVKGRMRLGLRALRDDL